MAGASARGFVSQNAFSASSVWDVNSGADWIEGLSFLPCEWICRRFLMKE